VRTDRLKRPLRAAARSGFGTGLALLFITFALGLLPRTSAGTDSKPPNPEQEAFFELKVRPLLVARCLRCHGEKEQKGGIRLDSAEALLGKTPDEGVVKPGHPESSRLMEVVSYKDDPKMPPDGKLPDADSQILREWIRRGAYFPSKESATATVSLSSPEGIVRAKKTLWSLQPVTSPIPPKVKNPEWVKTPIDQFVLAKLEANGLSPSAVVDRRTLLRRLSFDLIGLPPTFEAVRAFEQDRSPEAVERVVDRLPRRFTASAGAAIGSTSRDIPTRRAMSSPRNVAIPFRTPTAIT
jgi:hypothetical protein